MVTAQNIREQQGVEEVPVTMLTGSAATAGAPVALKPDGNGGYVGVNAAITTSFLPGHWGITPAAIASLATGKCIVKGAAATTGDKGTAGHIVTAYTATGSATTATFASGVAAAYLGLATATGIVIY